MGGARRHAGDDLLAPGRLVGAVDALVLSGGWPSGLAAADGVAMALRARGRGFEDRPATGCRSCLAAILFDLAGAARRTWVQNPYPALGRAAFEAAADVYAIGS